MENIDKIKCLLIDFENNDKTLDEAAKEILLLFSDSKRCEMLAIAALDKIARTVSSLVCPKCKSEAIAEYPDYKECRMCGNVW